MTKFTCLPAQCLRCGTCVSSCPKGLLRISAQGFPEMPEELSARCNNCGQCVAYCPTGAAQQELSRGKALEAALPYEESQKALVERFLRSRRSYRSYSAEAIPREELMELLETANYAPSGGNNRTLRWIILEDPKQTAALREKIAEWFDTVCRSHPVYSKRYAIDSILSRYRAGKDVILRGAPHVAYCVGPEKAVWGPVDTGIALMYFNLACEAHYIGCCFAGYATKAAESDAVREFLGVKEGERAWCALCFGRKTIPPVRVPSRGPVPVTFL